jgi:nitroreductase
MRWMAVPFFALEAVMDALEAIFTRRSVRLYALKPASRDVINEILKAGMCAPSAGNERPWHFIVLTDRSLLDEIPKFHPYAGMMKQAHAAVLVCGDTTLEKHKGYWVLDCAAATQNMLLAAHARGWDRCGAACIRPGTGLPIFRSS